MGANKMKKAILIGCLLFLGLGIIFINNNKKEQETLPIISILNENNDVEHCNIETNWQDEKSGKKITLISCETVEDAIDLANSSPMNQLVSNKLVISTSKEYKEALYIIFNKENELIVQNDIVDDKIVIDESIKEGVIIVNFIYDQGNIKIVFPFTV